MPENMRPMRSKGTDMRAAVSMLSNVAERREPERESF